MYQNLEFEKIKSCQLGQFGEIKELLDTIQRYYNKVNNKIDRCTPKYQEAVKSILDSFPIIEKEDLSGNKLYYTSNKQLIESKQFVEVLNQYIKKFESIEYLDFLSEENRNVVFVGPNGSGKTTLLRKLQRDTIDAKIKYFQADRVFLVNESFHPKKDYEKFIMDLRENYINAINIDYILRGNVIQEQFDYYIALLEIERNEENEAHNFNGKTEKIIREWGELVKDRELFFNHGLKVKTLDGKVYPIKYLSSGEKAILFFLIGVLLFEEQDYYFIDEPENNLNPAIVSMLWDFIEKNRPNSIFVYLTHDSNFVSSRINSRIYWIKKYNGEKWEWEEIVENEFLPQRLLVELAGNRAPVIFCESFDDSKYDAKLFTILFPEYKIISVSGSERVCNITKAYNDLHMSNTAYGIIDRDYKDEQWLEKLKADNIYHIPYHEVENFICQEKLVKLYIAMKFPKDESMLYFTRIKDTVKQAFIKRKDKFILRYAAFELRNHFYYRGRVNALDNCEQLKDLYNRERLSDKDFDMIVQKYTDLYNMILQEDNYDVFLKYLDYKGILNEIQAILSLDKKTLYCEEIFEILKVDSSKEILNSLRNEIFS